MLRFYPYNGSMFSHELEKWENVFLPICFSSRFTHLSKLNHKKIAVFIVLMIYFIVMVKSLIKRRKDDSNVRLNTNYYSISSDWYDSSARLHQEAEERQ